ncbi:MAG: hypothetical protein WCE73_18780 [Candidatus Angelobacter sp.]|jgi:hypothetical protein
MAAIQGKHSSSRTQGSRRRVHASTKPAVNKAARTKQQTSAGKHRKRERLPPSLRFTETKRGKTTVRRYSGRTVYRLEELKGKLVDLVEIFTAAESHSINVLFEDKTTLRFVIDPGFIMETEYADWKTGDWRPIKSWPLIHSETHRIKG